MPKQLVEKYVECRFLISDFMCAPYALRGRGNSVGTRTLKRTDFYGRVKCISKLMQLNPPKKRSI